jgi:hypothetical protein
MVERLRWILLIPVVVGSGYGIASISMAYHSRITAPCSSTPELPICSAPWYFAQWFWVPLIASMAVAIAVVTLAYFMAPSRKMLVAKIFFGAGAACAAYLEIFLGFLFGMWSISVAGVAAIAAGVMSLVLVARVHVNSEEVGPAHDA